MSQRTMFEVLESRTLLSSSNLATDQAALAAAIAQYDSDKTTSAAVLAADKAAIKQDKIQGDPAVAPLVTAWKEAILARDTTLATDALNLKTATDNDKITILQDRQDVRNDKADDNTSQLATDKAALSAAQLQLATDRSTLVDKLENDRITTKATIAADHEAIIAKRLADGADPLGIAARQQWVTDSIHWVDTLAVDRKTIAADKLAVSQDEHG